MQISRTLPLLAFAAFSISASAQSATFIAINYSSVSPQRALFGPMASQLPPQVQFDITAPSPAVVDHFKITLRYQDATGVVRTATTLCANQTDPAKAQGMSICVVLVDAIAIVDNTVDVFPPTSSMPQAVAAEAN
jgi:hypothetical protein